MGGGHSPLKRRSNFVIVALPAGGRVLLSASNQVGLAIAEVRIVLVEEGGAAVAGGAHSGELRDSLGPVRENVELLGETLQRTEYVGSGLNSLFKYESTTVRAQ